MNTIPFCDSHWYAGTPNSVNFTYPLVCLPCDSHFIKTIYAESCFNNSCENSFLGTAISGSVGYQSCYRFTEISMTVPFIAIVIISLLLPFFIITGRYVTFVKTVVAIDALLILCTVDIFKGIIVGINSDYTPIFSDSANHIATSLLVFSFILLLLLYINTNGTSPSCINFIDNSFFALLLVCTILITCYYINIYRPITESIKIPSIDIFGNPTKGFAFLNQINNLDRYIKFNISLVYITTFIQLCYLLCISRQNHYNIIPNANQV